MDYYKLYIKKRWIGEFIFINIMYNLKKFFYYYF